MKSVINLVLGVISGSLQAFNGTLDIYDPSGTVYDFATGNSASCENGGVSGGSALNTQSLPTLVEDRNGNLVTFNGVNCSTGAFTETDTVGRTVLSSSGFGTNGNTITVSGLSPYTVAWGTTPVRPALGSILRDTGDTYCSTTVVNPSGPAPVVTAITLPNGQKYQFFYDSASGLLSKIVYPTGGYVSYAWAPNTQSEFASLGDTNGNSQVCDYTYDTYAVSHRYVSYDGSTIALQQDFNYSTTWNPSNDYSQWTQKTATVTTHDLIQGTSYSTSYTYSPMNAPAIPDIHSVFATQIPMEQTTVYGNTNGQTAKTVSKTWYDLYLLKNEQMTLDTGQTSQVAYQYSGSQISEKDEYDFGQSSPAKETHINYQAFTSSPSGGPGAGVNKPCQTTVYDGSGNLAAETDYFYDGTPATSSPCGTAQTQSLPGATTPAGTHDETNFGPSSSYSRGNVTAITRRCFNNCTGEQNATSTYTYDETGQVLLMKDPKSNPTSYSYADSYASCGGAAPPAGSTDAYLTQIIDALGHTEAFCYGYNDGQLRGATDPNNRITTYKYADSLARLTETDYPDTGRTIISYNDAPPTPSVTTSKEITSGQYVTSTSVMNGLGLVTETELTSDPAGTDYTVTTYDGEGHTHTVSNPYRTTSDPTYGITTYTYDALGRTTQITHPDGSKISTSYTGRATQATDEGNGTKTVQRISQTDALGRLTSVCEVSGTTLLGTSPTPSACGQDIGATGFLTSYAYNALGNLTGVTQGGLNPRTFAYDSLSRLTSATNPESGQTSYAYDADSNLSTKTDARGITTTYAYDALNRMTSKTYSDGTTPGSYFTYDASSEWGVTLTNPIGRLALESADNGHAMAIFSYDPMGRTANEYQCTPLNCGSGAFPLPYTYDLAGDDLTSSNGEGVTFTQVFNTAAQLTTVTSSLSDSNHPGTLFSGATYGPFGAMSSAALGNGLTDVENYNNRGWVQSLAVNGNNLSEGNPASGSVSIGGSEKSSGSGTPGTGTVTISGSEQYIILMPQRTRLYDSGTVSITVNGIQAVQPYGQGSTSASIASGLVTQINGNSNSFVSATLSGSTITLTSKITGSNTNYSLSTSDTYDSNDFSGPSFEPSPIGSGWHLTGGTGGQLTYDSGTVSIAVNGLNESVSYANGSTSSSIAAALASAFNGAPGSPVTATSSGSLVTLTSKAVGSGTDYALSATSQTNNPGQFGSPSFTTSPSGQNLTGGTGGYSVSLSYAPNGVVLGANDSANGNWTYAYDDFNRLASANVTGQAYTYAYDRFGNRWQQNGPYTMMLTFTGANNRMDGYSYDAAGNVLNDGSHSYTYDAENRIVTVDGGATTYVYDANGQRVRKTVGGASTDYVYDQAGHAIAEVNASGWQRGEVYAGGRHLATYANSTTYFDHGDWLGTERARTAVNGTVCETITGLPFGDGMSTSGSCGDPSARHFTGKERDPESNLDYFGARYNSSSLGRFMSPDWAAKPTSVPYAEFGDPQSLNLYAYVRNNPISGVDPDGHNQSTLLQIADGPNGLSPDMMSDSGSFTDGFGDIIVDGSPEAMALQQAQQQNAAGMNAETAAVNLTRESIRNGHPAEYGGDIIKTNGKISFTKPIRGRNGSFNPSQVHVPKGATVVGVYHTHPESSAKEAEGPSVGDINYLRAPGRTGRVGYVAGSYSGVVYRYTGSEPVKGPFDTAIYGTRIGVVPCPASNGGTCQ